MTTDTHHKLRADGGYQEYTLDGETWWMDGDCPECGHVVYANGTVRVCGENDDNCEWWEKAEAVGT